MSQSQDHFGLPSDSREQVLWARQCLGCIHEGVVVTTLDGMIVETSPTAKHILELSPLDEAKRSMIDFSVVANIYEDMRQAASIEGRILNRPLLMKTASGKKKLLNVSIQRIGDSSTVQLVHVFQDCSDLHTLEQRLLQAERLATVGRFASQIAHEIRNPLNSISLNIELLQDEVAGAGPEARSLIGSVMRELDRLNSIVGEYLQFSRFPKADLQRGQIDDVVRSLRENFRPPDGIRLIVNEASSTPPVWIDVKLLRQVLDNLVRNAVEAIEGAGNIELRTEVLERFVVIRVRDEGKGISAEAQTKLFEPFFTTKPHGTGLGLATSQQIVFEHNGHLTVESEPGKGATFSIFLPL